MNLRHIILIEDSTLQAELIRKSLQHQKGEFHLEVCNSLTEFRNKLNAGLQCDLIISDWMLADGTSEKILDDPRIKDKVPVVFISSQGNEELAVSLVKNGAIDYMVKTAHFFQDICQVIRRALREWENIVARREAEQKLRETESKYRLITENINDVIWELDIDFKHYTFISDSIKGLLGYTPEEFLGLHFFDTIHPDCVEEIKKLRSELFKKLREGLNPQNFNVDLEIKFIHKNGSTLWGNSRGFLITNERRQVVAVGGVTRNISAQKLAEKQLKIQEAFFETLIREAPIAIVILDNDDRIQQINRSFSQLFEYETEECTGKRINELIVPEELVEEGNELTHKARMGEILSFETQRRTRTGQLIDVHIHGKPVVLNNSQLGVLGIYQDISGQKQYEKQLKALSERLLLATSSASIGIWDYDLSTGKLIWEDEMYTLHGIKKSANASLLHQWENVILENDKAFLQYIFNQKIFVRETFEKTYRIHGPREEARYIKLFASVHFEQDRATRIVGCCWDITNEVANAELNKKMEVSAKVASIKQQFLANMSHEIRSPMTGIMGMIDLLMKTPLSDQQHFYAETIKKSSDGLLHIVNDILDLSKIEAGKMIIKHAAFNLKKSGNTLFGLFHALASQKGLTFKLQIDEALPDCIVADENRISQIITNLLSNAIKFTEKGEVCLAYQLLGDDGEQVTLRISVSDTGIGISQEDSARLFKMFSQVDTSDTRNYDGAGLGLSISEKLAELMNARIDMESEPGKGSVFSLTLKCPRLKDEDKSVFLPDTPAGESDGDLSFRVLLVEDKPTNQMVISLMLREIGCSVEVASNGQIALDMMEPGKYDFIFMDIQMPVMDGLTAVRRLRAQYKEKELPFIIGLSAKAMEGDPEYYISRGMNDYLTKPVTTEILAACLRKWAEKLERGEQKVG